MKRFFSVLIALTGLGYVLALLLMTYALFSDRWWEVEPWLGVSPEIVSFERSDVGLRWCFKADEEMLQTMAQRLRADPVEVSEGATFLKGYGTPCSYRLLTPNGWVVTPSSLWEIARLENGDVRLTFSSFDDDGPGSVDLRVVSFPIMHYLLIAGGVVLLIGPALPVAGVLALSLPPGKHRRLLWYLLPLLHALYLFGFLYLLHLEEQECACDEMPLLLPALTWCAFSLLQSATADAAVSLVSYFRSRHA